MNDVFLNIYIWLLFLFGTYGNGELYALFIKINTCLKEFFEKYFIFSIKLALH